MKSRKLSLLLILSASLALSGCDIFNIFPTDQIELESESVTLNLADDLNCSYQIIPTIETDKDVLYTFTYESKNPAVAEVSSTGLVTAKSVGETEIKITTNNFFVKEKILPITVVNDESIIPEPDYDYDYTVMIYMCGSDLESGTYTYRGEVYYNAAATSDIEEILSVNFPDNVKVILETGGSSHWSLSSTKISGKTSISHTKLQRWVVDNHKLKFVKEINNNVIASQANLQSFLEWGLTDYAAKKMGLILWNHGGGMSGVLSDENNNDESLATYQVAGAVQGALAKVNRRKLEWIGYDACVMSVADIASVNASYFKYMVASQESEYGDGWDYSTWMPKLFDGTSTEDMLSLISSSFVSYYHQYCQTYSLNYETCYQTCSVLKLSEMDGLINAMNSYVTSMSGTKTNKYSKIVNAMKQSLNFGSTEIDDNYGYVCTGCYFGNVDLKDLFTNLYNTTHISNDAIFEALDKVVIKNSYCSHYSPKPCGLCAFVPEPVITDGTDTYYCGYMWVEKNQYEGDMNSKISKWQELMLTSSHFYPSN